MAPTVYPTGAAGVGGQPAIAGYEVESWTPGFRVVSEDYDKGAGDRLCRVVYDRIATITASLLVTSGTPATDFPEGQMCTVSGYTNYFVNEAKPVKTKGVTRLDIDMEAIAPIVTTTTTTAGG